jgi:shikimate 5-dehydrogenase
MLIYQGAAAFKLWTDVEPVISEMSKVVYSLMANQTPGKPDSGPHQGD